MDKNQYPVSSFEWSAITKLEVAEYNRKLWQELDAHRPAFLRQDPEEEC